MSLVNKRSNLDRNVRGDAGPDMDLGNPVGQNNPSEGSFFTANGTSNSPFSERDHLKALLENKIVTSNNSKSTYDPSLMIGNKPGPTNAIDSFPDLNGVDGNLVQPFQREKSVADQIQQSSKWLGEVATSFV